MKLCFYVISLALAAVLASAQEAPEAQGFDNYEEDYDNFYDYDQLKVESDKLEAELDKLDAQSDLIVKEDINNFKEDQEHVDDIEAKDPVDYIDGYQFEDNRDKPKDIKEDIKDVPAESDGNFEAGDDINMPIDSGDIDKKIDVHADYALLWGDDSVAPLPVPAADAINAEDPIDDIDDYQFEDNRDKSKDMQEDLKDIPSDSDESFEDDIIAPIDSADVAKNKDVQADYALLWGDDSVAPLPVPDAEPVSEDKDILKETQKILENDTDNFDEEINKLIAYAETFSENKPDDGILIETKKILDESDDSFNNNDDEIKTNEEIIDETRKILEEIDDSFNNDEDQLNNNKEPVDDEQKPIITNDFPIEKILGGIPVENNVEESDGQYKESEDKDRNIVEHDVVVEEDTVDKVYADLNADLDKLLDTLDKLSDNGSENAEKVEEVDKLDDKFFKKDDNNVQGSEELVEDDKSNADYVNIDFEKILEDLKNEDDMKVDDSAANFDINVLQNDQLNEPNPDDAFERDVEPLPNINAEPILYVDAILDEQNNAESVENVNENDNKSPEIDASVESKDRKTKKNLADVDSSVEQPIKFKTVDINSLNSEELEGLVAQFSKAHSDVLDIHADTFDQNVAPIHIKLSVDNPVVVTSPNYPSPYPTNNIIDWIFDGEGMGIEMNITDFLVNGALGDYLLVKPGGIDESGHEGLLLTYRLNSEKRFRFTDVDRLFVRFESKLGMMFMRGFQFSVKMIAPLPEEPEPIPEPEPVVEPPHSRLTIHLATAVPQFNELAESFRVLLAAMGEQYIIDNDIEPGLNSTVEITQITSVSTCPVSWPNYELCTAVTFGISLNYEDGDDMLDEDALLDMWSTYSTRDPYALLLKNMGVAEFNPPNSSVLTAWLVIASGVVISMVMLAVVLWRFSCFEDYTRMKTYSDTDSLHNEKRGLDLYPTPHQTLPPLVSESEYKWPASDDTTRVDMGGLANRSYARDMYDFESDEEIITSRDRTGAVTARDIYDGSNA